MIDTINIYPSSLFLLTDLLFIKSLGEQKEKEEEERDLTQQIFSPGPAHCQERLDTPRPRGHSSDFYNL